jgi:hypothetical protein
LWKKGVGFEISMDEAARLALVKSDNTAVEALAPVITDKDFDDVYQGLDIDIQVSSQGAILNAKNYASIMKALYFSAVLTKDDSQKILRYLTESDFDDKLVAGVPRDVNYSCFSLLRRRKLAIVANVFDEKRRPEINDKGSETLSVSESTSSKILFVLISVVLSSRRIRKT